MQRVLRCVFDEVAALSCSRHNTKLRSDLPCYVAIANDLSENLVSKFQSRNLVVRVLHVDEEDVFSGIDHARADNLWLVVSHGLCMVGS